MSDQATILRDLVVHREERIEESPSNAPRRSFTIAVTSGKGGVGKSNIALNLAIALAEMQSTVCLLDANLGLGSIDLLCGLNGYWNLSHVVTGARSLADVMLKGPGGIDVIPGASGLIDLADCPAAAQQTLLKKMEQLESEHDFLVVDTGTGIHRPVRLFTTSADLALVVTTPEVTSVADAYATVKALCNAEIPQLHVLVNQADSSSQARQILSRLQQTSRIFLHVDVISAGHIPRDECVVDAVRRRTPFLIDTPKAPASQAVRQLAQSVKSLADSQPRQGTFFSRFWQRYCGRVA